MQFYLAHPFPDRHLIRDKIEPLIEKETGLDLINPFYDERYEREDVTKVDAGMQHASDQSLNPQKIVDGDLANVKRASGVIAIVSPNISVGTFMELFYSAYVLHGDCYVICLEGVTERQSQHPWLRYMTNEHIFKSPEEFIKYWKEEVVK